MAHAKRLWPKHSSPTNIQIERDNMQYKVSIEASEVRAILFEAIDHGGNPMGIKPSIERGQHDNSQRL